MIFYGIIFNNMNIIRLDRKSLFILSKRSQAIVEMLMIHRVPQTNGGSRTALLKECGTGDDFFSEYRLFSAKNIGGIYKPL